MYLLDMPGWWYALSSFEKIFWGMAILFTVLFVIQTVLSFVVGDGDHAMGDSDAAVEGDHGIGYGFFTIKNFIAFFTVFGWTGAALSQGTMNKGLVVFFSFLAGFMMVAIMILLLRSMSKLKQSGTLEMKNAIGVIGETYLIIPASRNGFGKVHVKVQGSLHELQAITDDAEFIATGRLIKVIEVINDSVLLVTVKM